MPWRGRDIAHPCDRRGGDGARSSDRACERHHHDPAVSRQPWPADEALRKEWVAAMVRDIDYRCAMGRRGLLTDLLRAAWPSWAAQDQ
jgi:hypothetical protein